MLLEPGVSERRLASVARRTQDTLVIKEIFKIYIFPKHRRQIKISQNKDIKESEYVISRHKAKKSISLCWR